MTPDRGHVVRKVLSPPDASRVEASLQRVVDQTEARKALQAMAPCRSKGMSTREYFFVTVR
jgi:hypothetical protein